MGDRLDLERIGDDHPRDEPRQHARDRHAVAGGLDPIESLHRGLRKIIKTRGAFPSDEAATKLLYLSLRNSWRSLEAFHRVASRLRAVHHLLCRAFAYYTPLMTTRHGTLAHS